MRPFRVVLVVGLLVGLVGLAAAWRHAYLTGSDAFRRDLEGLDLYGAELQDPFLAAAGKYCSLSTADDTVRRRLFSPSARTEKDLTESDHSNAIVASSAVHRLCPDKTDLLPSNT